MPKLLTVPCKVILLENLQLRRTRKNDIALTIVFADIPRAQLITNFSDATIVPTLNVLSAKHMRFLLCQIPHLQHNGKHYFIGRIKKPILEFQRIGNMTQQKRKGEGGREGIRCQKMLIKLNSEAYLMFWLERSPSIFF